MINKIHNTNTKLQRLIPFVIYLFTSSHAFSATTEVTPNANFVSKETQQKGWVQYSYPLDGEYVYQPKTTDGRLKNKPFLIEKPQRTNYDFLSAEEQSSLSALRDLQSEINSDPKPSSIRKVDHTTHHPKHKKSGLLLKWPRIVVDEDNVCVPTIPFSEADDWKQHLTCKPKPTGGNDGR